MTITRTPAQLRALRRFAMRFAWQRARHVVSVFMPGARDLVTEARKLLSLGWREAKLAERHGRLPAEDPPTVALVIAPRTVAVIRAEIEDMENRDRLGVTGLARLVALGSELTAIRALAA